MSLCVLLLLQFFFSIVPPNQRLKFALVLGLIIICGIVLYLFNPENSNLYAPCPFKTLTGFYCPGCGSLRALHQLLHGHIGAACRLNALMVCSLPILGYSFLSNLAFVIRRRHFPKIFVPAIWIWLMLVVIILFWIVRNIPLEPFSLLAPI